MDLSDKSHYKQMKVLSLAEALPVFLGLALPKLLLNMFFAIQEVFPGKIRAGQREEEGGILASSYEFFEIPRNSW